MHRYRTWMLTRWNRVQRGGCFVTCSVILHCHISHYNFNKYVRLRRLTYIHTCRSYVHTLRELDRRHVVESPTGTFIVLHALADSSDFGLLGKQSSPKWEIPCRGRRWTAVQNLMLLALSSAEKSVTVQKKQTKLQTVNDISTPCLSACVDNNHIGLLIQQKYLHIYSAVLNMCHNGHEHKYDAKIDNEK